MFFKALIEFRTKRRKKASFGMPNVLCTFRCPDLFNISYILQCLMVYRH